MRALSGECYAGTLLNLESFLQSQDGIGETKSRFHILRIRNVRQVTSLCFINRGSLYTIWKIAMHRYWRAGSIILRIYVWSLTPTWKPGVVIGIDNLGTENPWHFLTANLAEIRELQFQWENLSLKRWWRERQQTTISSLHTYVHIHMHTYEHVQTYSKQSFIYLKDIHLINAWFPYVSTNSLH